MSAITLVRISVQLTKRASLRRFLSAASNPPETFSEQDQFTARQWLSKLDINTIPRHLGQVTFSRSSGPGGQNVNKVNSKATLRFFMKDLLSIVPIVLHPKLRASKYHAEKSHSLVIQADGRRKQSANVDACFEKLRLMIEAGGKSAVRGETSPEQAAKVRIMEKRGNEARLRAKKSHSSKKSARRGDSQ